MRSVLLLLLPTLSITPPAPERTSCTMLRVNIIRLSILVIASHTRTVVGFSSSNFARALRFRPVEYRASHQRHGQHVSNDIEIKTDVDRNKDELQYFLQSISKSFASALLAVVVVSSQPTVTDAAVTNKVSTTSVTAARIHLNSLPPSTVAVKIGDLPVVGPLVSGTYSKTDDESLILKKMLKRKDKNVVDVSAPVVIQSPADKVLAVKNIAQGGHLEFDIDGPILQTHLDIDVAASEPGVATIRVVSPIIPRLPFNNAASDLVPPAAMTLKKARQTPKRTTGPITDSLSAAHISLNSLPPAAISVEIEDLPVLGKLLSGLYTKVDDVASDNENRQTAAVTIESPQDKVAAIKAIASRGHLEFDIDGLLNTHLDVDVATDTAGSATIRVASPIIPALPFQNAASF
jgi:hypothetical protein